MNKEIMRALGFEEQVSRFEHGVCTTCGSVIDKDGFKDAMSRREYGSSGMCQKCQDKTFDAPNRM